MLMKCLKEVVKYVCLFIGLVIFYVIFLVIGQAIPREKVLDNVEQSYKQLKEIGLYFEVVDGAGWDNWTDTYFINSAVTEYNGNLLQKAIANAYTSVRGNDESGEANVIDDIKYAIDKDVNASIKSYSRYWAGMLTIYKILLIFMPINGIRTFSLGIVLVLFSASSVYIYKIVGKNGLIPYVISMVIALYIPQSMCLVFSIDVIIMLFMMNICCILLERKASVESFYKLFFIMSSLLVYLIQILKT